MFNLSLILNLILWPCEHGAR